MPFSALGSIADGMFADYEVLRKLADNDNYLKEIVPSVTFKTIDNKRYYNDENSNIRIQCGTFKFNNLQTTRSYEIKLTQASKVAPNVVVQITGTPNVKAYLTKIGSNSFFVNLVATTAGPITGAVCWQAITIDT